MTIATVGVMGEIPRIRFKGVFDWKGLYRFMRAWYDENRYLFDEKRYKHKGDEVEVELTGKRKIDQMYRFQVFMSIHIWELRDVEVEENGRKVKKNHGRFELTINGKIEVDYSGRFSEGKWSKMIGKLWFRVVKNDFDSNVADVFYYDLYKLHRDLKSYLNMTMDTNAF